LENILINGHAGGWIKNFENLRRTEPVQVASGETSNLTTTNVVGVRFTLSGDFDSAYNQVRKRASCRVRTDDLFITNEVLYQLS